MELMIDECDFLFLAGGEELFRVVGGLGIGGGFFGFPGRGSGAIVVALGRRGGWGEGGCGCVEGDRAEAGGFYFGGGDEGQNVPLQLLLEGLHDIRSGYRQG